MKASFIASLLTGAFLLAACDGEEAASQVKAAADNARDQMSTGTAAEARDFVSDYNRQLEDRVPDWARISWIRATYITPDTEALDARTTEEQLEFNSETVEAAKRFNGVEMDPETARAIRLIKLGSSMPAPNDDALRKELAEISQRMSSTYARGEYCPDGPDSCMNLEDLTRILAESRDFDELRDVWAGWRQISRPIRADYERFAEITRMGAAELDFEDLGAMWRSGYDMAPDDFAAEIERLWSQVKPLYDELHCHVRAKLAEEYGSDKVRAGKPIPAHLLGNMWSQSWANIYDLVEPYPGVSNLDITGAMEDQDWTVEQMFRQAEDFYTGLGMEALPDTFWERTMFTRPQDRDVVCHPSAWPIDGDKDVRIKMCTRVNEEDLTTIFHELGHVYYFLAYRDLPMLYHGGAHDGFHEAIGDTVVLSMTPAFLQEIGLIDNYEPNERATINEQMKAALDRIAFLPWAKLVDQWRWNVFSGETTPDNYNADWWSLRNEYQGIAPPVTRSENDFDPGAKYHVPGNTPYNRYFLAFILQYQFQRSLCDAAGFEGPLHECSVYGSKEAGEKFSRMLELGMSKPWRDALEELTGSPDMDASAIVEYFAPLMTFLKDKNEGRTCGW